MTAEERPLDDLVRDRLRAFFARLGDGSPGDLYRVVLDSVERSLLEVALERSGGSQLEAARLLGLHRNTLREKVRRHGMARVLRAARAGRTSRRGRRA